MQYARLGDTGLVVSRMAFGVMTFGRAEGIFASVSKVDQPLADQLVGRAIDQGVNFFNTADVYTGGQSESMLAQAVGDRRKDVIIATKAGFRVGPALVHQGLSRHHLMDAAEASLKRLRTDYIDILLAHRMDTLTPVEETLEALADLVKQGKVRYAGFSNWPAWFAATSVGIQKANGWPVFRAAELYYSLVGRDLEHELAPFLQDAGIGLMVWSPLAGGFLTGKYTKDNPQGDGGRLTGFDFLPYDRERGYRIVDELRAIAGAHGVTPAHVALAWLLSKRVVASILIGATKLEQLNDNLAAADLKLSAEELERLDKVSAVAPIYPNWFTDRVKDAPVAEALAKSGL